MIPDKLKAITDEELLALSQRNVFSGQKSTRRELKNDPHFGQQVEPSSTPHLTGKKERPFDPKHDVSEDARYLWARIFLWFWLVPLVSSVVFALLYFLSQ